MKAFTRLLPASLIIACLTSPAAFSASFDCSKAGTLVESAVCTTPSLSAKDDLLNERYQPLKDRKVFRELERQWLREVRNRCASAACLEDAYDQQIARLTPASPQAETAPLAPLPEQQIYRRIEEAPWQRFALATIPEVNARSFVQVVDVATLDGVLNVVIFVGQSPDQSTRNPGAIAGRRYFGSLYEYSDARPGLHPIVRDIRFSGWNKTGANDQGARYAGIIDGVFYYRQRMEGEAEQSMAYTLGSKLAPQPSTRLYAAEPSSMRFSKARIAQDLNADNTGLLLHYPYTHDGNSYDRVMDPNDGGWSLVNPVWNETRPVLYFDNSGDFACVWRVDLQHKTLEKIVPEHEAISAYPVDVLGREAVVYLETDRLMVAIAPDQ
ncbi:lysozyme inhibitor LprI family protein [Pseudomonas sp. BBP2017]|uniref:lysozyme inhibitor LprI family protein n=1 Tax=Pseudomonas sp. BBP2017 TaxID=2109731 RepID=UPI000D1211E9|nr:hypothetical protein [Pseudomonas sp. BBP2017]PSS53710.1 hypothetical protein C6382_15390 [Pseudomonas sp. BBP2017]